MLNILLADDHEIITKGLKLIIKKNFTAAKVDEVNNGNAAFEKIKQKDYQLIVLDVNMPDTSPFILVKSILDLKPASNILMFTMNAEDVYAKKYLQLGVKGYLSKTSSEPEIKTALANVMEGKSYRSALLNQVLADEVLGKISSNPFDNLSPRELEIVLHLIKGVPIATICKELKIHPSTIGTHKMRIFKKLNSNNIMDISALAKAHNLVPASR